MHTIIVIGSARCLGKLGQSQQCEAAAGAYDEHNVKVAVKNVKLYVT